MQPFIEKVAAAVERNPAGIDAASPLSFLSTWESPVLEKDLEALTEPGKQDAFDFGKRFRVLYKQLLPPKRLGKGKPRKGDKVKVRFWDFRGDGGELIEECIRRPSRSSLPALGGMSGPRRRGCEARSRTGRKASTARVTASLSASSRYRTT